MRRIFLALTVAAMMAAFAAPAKADVVDVDTDDVLDDGTVFLVDDASSSFGDLCSPLIDGIDIPGCVFNGDDDIDIDGGFVIGNGSVGDFDGDDSDIDLDDGGFVGSFDGDDFDVDFGHGGGKIGNGHNGGSIGKSHRGGGGGKGKK
jgi:hypothetical protein